MKKFLIYLGILLFWLIVIFLFSDVPNSGDTTRNIIESISNYLNMGISNEAIGHINFIIRKCAHVLEYFILTVIVLNLVKLIFSNREKIMYYSFLITFLFAGCDEYHQSFIPGRSSAFGDVLIDSIGILLVLIIYRFLGCKHKF